MTRTNNGEDEQTRETMVTQKDITDKRVYCQLSPPPPPRHSEAASDSRHPHSTLGSMWSAPHMNDHVTSSVSMETSHLGVINSRTKRDISWKGQENRQRIFYKKPPHRMKDKVSRIGNRGLYFLTFHQFNAF